MAIGSHHLSQQGAITKRMTSIEEMDGMDVLSSDKIGTLILNKLTVGKSMVEECMELPVKQEKVSLKYKRTATTYTDANGNWHRVSKGASEQTAFTSKKDYGKGEREEQLVQAQRTLHGLQPAQPSEMFNDKSTYRELSEIADQAKRRAEVAGQGSKQLINP
ncbi:hypothetical protein IGI04_006751 [Brassica rapa subsp. trilocularis]|uniref:Uncharacterized protein n=1 Tax=Brassica rapa subsp. trilocularis TaxID=1813537 RepID=A0ABQ7NHQ9_BRACM|nr:hypothetical protein IGI04_006751 [Brassica rapa subsp. trilocularis]